MSSKMSILNPIWILVITLKTRRFLPAVVTTALSSAGHCALTIYLFQIQSTKIKKGSKGDTSVLKPTLMAAVPVSLQSIQVYQ